MSLECSTAKWIQLPSFPFSWFSNALLINKDEFIVAPYKTTDDKSHGVYKFNIHKNEWIKVLDYDKNITYFAQSAAYNKTNQLL